MLAAAYDWRTGWCDEDVVDMRSGELLPSVQRQMRNYRAGVKTTKEKLTCNSLAIANWIAVCACVCACVCG